MDEERVPYAVISPQESPSQKRTIPLTITADGKLRVEASVIIGGIEVDITSLERGGDDSTTADLDAKDVLGTGLQTTISGIKCDVSTITAAQRATLFGLLSGSKVYAEMPNGDLRLLQLDAAGNLKVNAVVDVNVDIVSLERGGDDSVSADLNVGSAPVTPANPVSVKPGTGVDFPIDSVSLERGGDDSVSSDLNAKDTLGAGAQTTVSGIKSDVSTITPAQRATLFAALTAAKIFGEDATGNLKIFRVDSLGNLSVTPPAANSHEESATAGAVDVAVNFGFETLVIQLVNDSATEDILFTFRKLSEGVAPATGTALRTLTMKPAEYKNMDTARFLGLKYKRAAALDAPLRISAW